MNASTQNEFKSIFWYNIFTVGKSQYRLSMEAVLLKNKYVWIDQMQHTKKMTSTVHIQYGTDSNNQPHP